MKFISAFILGLFFLLGVSTALALDHNVYVSGRGTASAYCQSSNTFCKSNVQRQAERDGQRDAENRCRSQGGVLVSTSGCSTSCSPNYLPPNSPPTWVRCTSNCSLPCRVPDFYFEDENY